jgi:hypothetical protein
MSNKGQRMSNSLVRISIIFFFLILAFLLIDVDSDLLKVKWTFFSRSLNLLFTRLGFGGPAALAIVFLLRALFSAEEIPLWMYPSGADAGSEASVNQEQHQPSRPGGPAAPIQNGSASASTSSVEQPAPTAKRLIDDIVDFVANKLEDPGQPQGPIYEQALRLVWYELEIDGSTNQDELQRWLVSLRENPRQYKSIFGFSRGDFL